MSNRGDQWEIFSDLVKNHVENYSVPQYGDAPNDQAESFTLEEIQMNMKRYVNRIGSGQRGVAEAIRDSKKLAHYACLLHARIIKENIDGGLSTKA